MFLTALFIGIVLIERLPGVLVTTGVPYEWLMFGTFKISLIDDITHGISGILGIIAIVRGYRCTVKYLMLIGGYYALDALFFIVYGFITGQGIIDNLMLNGPHIGITVLVAYALKKSIKHLELNETSL
jgi:hypothetical protein